MFGFDHHLASYSHGGQLLVVIAVACILGLRHASDPDHLAALTTLIAGSRERAARHAGRLGLAWGLGHATSLFAFGLPIVLYNAYLPPGVQQAAETTIGLVIIALALWLFVRWRRGFFHLHAHAHEESLHLHGHTHAHGGGHPHGAAKARSPLQAYGIGLVHGIGGSAGVGVLLLATIDSRVVAVLALSLFALCTAASMAILSTGFALTLTRAAVQRSFDRVAPVLGLASLAFGAWYALSALDIAPYLF